MFSYLQPSQAKYNKKVQETIGFVTEKQLKDKPLWKKFANQFRVRLDNNDYGWRGEYWGKMMRGACLTYQYSNDQELYGVLEYAVNELLKTQDELGRISTFNVEKEFSGWDMWSRKYVLSGLQHFYDICKDQTLKTQILQTMKTSADYIVDHIGEGKIDIRTTSQWWGALNSCTILEPFIQLYKLTNDKKYLDFAEYIMSTGGCLYENLLEEIKKDGVYPFQYPVTKAYEMMSFFEGVLAYYEVTRDKQYLDMVKKFTEDIYLTERTVIGGLSGKEELFDNFYVKQTEKQPTIVQETCVTVTWIRLLMRLYFNTGDKVYIDRIERSAFNALWGSLNTEWNKHYSKMAKGYVDALPFDSYSPLVYDKRGLDVGGFRVMEDGSNYGCCACIGAAGIALVPLLATLMQDDTVVINFYFDGEIQTFLPSGANVSIKITSDYPSNGSIKIKVNSDKKEKITLKLRKPYWCENAKIQGVDFAEKDGYYIIEKQFNNDEISLEFLTSITKETLNDKTALVCGPLVLALDEEKGNTEIDKEMLLKDDTGKIEIPEKNEMFRYSIERVGGDKLIFTDYASCGKNWHNSDAKVSVWLNVK